MKPNIPEGYRELEIGKIIPEGAMFWSISSEEWVESKNAGRMSNITPYYIAPIIEEGLTQKEPTMWEPKKKVTTHTSSPFSNVPALRKKHPVYSGFVNYFPKSISKFCEDLSFDISEYAEAIALVCHISYLGNEQHNPGTALHWDRSKSGDELDAMMRHTFDKDWGQMTWRAFANLEKKMEAGYEPPDERLTSWEKLSTRANDLVYCTIIGDWELVAFLSLKRLQHEIVENGYTCTAI